MYIWVHVCVFACCHCQRAWAWTRVPNIIECLLTSTYMHTHKHLYIQVVGWSVDCTAKYSSFWLLLLFIYYFSIWSVSSVLTLRAAPTWLSLSHYKTQHWTQLNSTTAYDDLTWLYVTALHRLLVCFVAWDEAGLNSSDSSLRTQRPFQYTYICTYIHICMFYKYIALSETEVLVLSG